MKKIAVIGGGVTGVSVAYHLSTRGLGEVQLFERDRLGSGSTWHSAGNITWKPVDDNDLPVRYLLDLVARLERETGLASGWRQTGRLFLARDAKMLASFTPFHEGALAGGLDAAFLEPAEAAKRNPLLDPSALHGAWFNPLAGRLNPADLVALYARAARQAGAQIAEQGTVSELVVEGGRVTGLVVNGEAQVFDEVVLCAGLWSRDLLTPHGLALAQWGCEHFYIICDVSPRLQAETPSFVSPADLIYGREEVGGLLLGCFDEAAVPVATSDLPEPFTFALLPDNWDKFAPYFEGAVRLFPALEEAPVRQFLNGPECFTADGNPLIGRLDGVDGLCVCTAMNSHGVTLSGGAGHIVADMIEGVEPRFDASIYAPGRFGERAADEAWLKQAASDAPSGYYRQTNPL